MSWGGHFGRLYKGKKKAVAKLHPENGRRRAKKEKELLLKVIKK